MIVVTYQNLPHRIPALVHANSDDSYTIIVNNNLSDEGKKDAIKHEVYHIMGGDFFKDEDVGCLEASCHRRSKNFEVSEDLDIYIK